MSLVGELMYPYPNTGIKEYTFMRVDKKVQGKNVCTPPPPGGGGGTRVIW